MEPGKTGTIVGVNTISKLTISELNDKCRDLTNSIIANYKYKLPRGTRIYFAGPWFTEKGKILYDTCQIIEQLSDTTFKIFYPRNEVNNTPKDAFENNVKHIVECDVLVALVSEKDVGTAWEIGMAYALNKPIYLLGYDETTFLSHTNVMLAFTGKCLTFKEYEKFLTNNKPKFVKINNTWEGKE